MFVFVYFQYVMLFIFRSSVATDGVKILHRIGPMCIADVYIGDDIVIGFPTSLIGGQLVGIFQAVEIADGAAGTPPATLRIGQRDRGHAAEVVNAIRHSLLVPRLVRWNNRL
jgi:hypothetical protein